MALKLALSILVLSSSFPTLHAADPALSKLVEGLGRTFKQSHQDYEKKKPAIPAPLENQERVPALNHLRILLETEDLLRQLREDTETKTNQVKLDILSPSEQSRILDMREKALVERIELLVNPPRRPSYRDQEKLLKGYQSKARKAVARKNNALKELDKIYSRNLVNESEKERVKAKIDDARKELEQLRQAFFGASAAIEGFEAPFTSTSPGPAEDLLAKVIEARDLILKELRLEKGNPAKQNDGEGKKEAVISGITVRSENLGVLLDHSGSMKPFLQPLRDEISKDFPTAHFRECYGCALNWHSTGAIDKRSQVLLFMEDLVVVKKVDAIYWFSDLKDPVSEAGLHRLSQLRSRGKTSLYVLSVGDKPDRDLETQIDSFSRHKSR